METKCTSGNNISEVLDINSKEDINQSNYLKKKKCHEESKMRKEKLSSKQNYEKTNEIKKLEMYKMITRGDLQELCDQLSSFNQRIQDAQEIIQLRFDLPNEMRDKLETEAGELDCLYKEIESAANNLETIRYQREAVGKEKLCMESQLSRLKNDAINELEVIVSVYDTPMLERWTEIKAQNSVAATEIFLHDVKGKLQAMKNLQTLASQKLLDLQKESRKEEKTTKKEKRKRTREERGARDPDVTNSSHTSLAFLMDSDSEDLVDDPCVHSVLYSLVCDQVLNLPAWTQNHLDID
uniref:Uncharacterized protein n=1 Tax=Cuerna arida TaxID=1464854 RepID=A0A1B6G0I9_9HEMI